MGRGRCWFPVGQWWTVRNWGGGWKARRGGPDLMSMCSSGVMVMDLCSISVWGVWVLDACRGRYLYLPGILIFRRWCSVVIIAATTTIPTSIQPQETAVMHRPSFRHGHRARNISGHRGHRPRRGELRQSGGSGSVRSCLSTHVLGSRGPQRPWSYNRCPR